MNESLGTFTIDILQPADLLVCESMSFPAYRHLLNLQPGLRLPNEAEQRLIQPIALVARSGDQPVALAMAELPLNQAEGAPELLSLFVSSPYRGQGIATALVEAIEDTLRAGGATSVEAVYTTGKASIPAVERIFEKRGWETPAMRSLTVRFTLAEALSTPWYGKSGLPAGAEIFSWADLTPGEYAALRESNEREPWIPNSLQPWRHDEIGFDPVSSVGLRYRGEVLGWVINHQVSPDTVRFTCSFMHPSLSRRARILPLYSEAVRRLAEAGCQYCTFITPTVYPPMIDFIRRHCAPYASFTGETRGTRKSLLTP
jgi:GNAT superfamily N-acetyltransferase